MGAGPGATSFHILACLALSPRARAVAGEAVQLARRLGARLTFVHVATDSHANRAALEPVLAEARAVHPADCVIRPGRPDEVVRRVALELGPQLVVAGALEHESLVEGLFGSVARRIVRNVPASVLLFSEPQPEGNPFSTIAISTQLDEASAHMLQFGLRLARASGARQLHILYEPDYYDRLAGRFRETGEDERHRRTAQQLELHAFLEPFQFPNLEVTTAVQEGGEGLEAVEYARAHACDLLIYAAPPRRLRFWDRFFQHPAETVMERLPCAVLIYRDIPVEPGVPDAQRERMP